MGVVHEEKPIPALKAASVFTFFFFSTPWKNDLPLAHPQDEDGGDTGRRWCPHLHCCPQPTSPISPGLSPRQGLAPFRLCCSHCKVRLPYLLGFSTGGQFVESLAVKPVVFPVMSPVRMSCHPALKFCDANAKPSGRRAGPRPAPHSTGEKWRKNTFFFLNEKTNARNGHSWVKMNWAVRKRDTRLGRITF